MTRETFAERMRRQLRGEILDAAGELLATHGYSGLKMAEVAAKVGVSRQTVYNEYSDKWTLVSALAARKTHQIAEQVRPHMVSAPDPRSAVRALVCHVLRAATDDALLRAALTGESADALLPLLTHRGEPVLKVARAELAADLLRCWPCLDRRQVAVVADHVIALILSHLVLPREDLPRAADAIADVAGALLAVPAHGTRQSAQSTR